MYTKGPQHTNSCTERYVIAEELSKTSLAPHTDCPRCTLNNAAPDLLEACKVAVLALTHDPINPKDVEFVQAAIAKATK